MLNPQKNKAIEYKLQGKTKTDIAQLLGVSRTSIYNWFEEDEVKAEVATLEREIKIQGKSMILNKLSSHIDELEKITFDSTVSSKIRSDNLQYLIDQVIGKPTTKIETNTEQEGKNNVSKDILEDVFNEVGQGKQP